MKTIVIAGTVGKDAVLRHTQDGDGILGFSVAVDDGYGQNKSTMWFDVSIFGKRGQALEKHITKGSKVTVVGEFATRVHEDRTYLTVRANEVELQGGKRQQEDDRDSYGNKPAKQNSRSANNADFDDQIPF